MSAVTPDLYRPMYGDKVTQFFDKLLGDRERRQAADAALSGKLLGPVLGSASRRKGDAIPAQVREIGVSFNTVLAYRDPTQKIVYDNYMTVRSHLDFLKEWIDERIADLTTGKTPNPEKTFAWYWIKNGGEGEYFDHKDVVFEVFHNFVALQPVGQHALQHHAEARPRHRRSGGQSLVQEDDGRRPRQCGWQPFTPLERFVMELFRTISPNGGSISALRSEAAAFERHGYIITPAHEATSFDPVHWKNPDELRPVTLQDCADEPGDR